MQNEHDQVQEWLRGWWKLAGDIVTNYDDSPPQNPWAWDAWVWAGVSSIPGEVDGVSTAPLVDMLKAIVALWEPGPEHGPKRTKEELWALSSAAWTAYNRLHAAAEQESDDSPTDTAKGATQPAGPAIVEGPAASPERAAAANPGSALPASPVAAEGTQGASVAVRWSNYRKPADWRELLEEAKARFTSRRGWSKERAKDPAAFDGSKTWVRMSQTKALELGLRLPEFETAAK
jgi:hypothetical protein